MSDERLLRQFIVQHNLVTPEKLADAVESRKEILKTGAGVSLEDVLVRKGYLNAHQVNMIHAATGRGRTDLLQGFEILGKLGQGGMGAVYKARQIALDRIVALKIMLPSYAREPGAVDRFLRETRVLAKLSHPNIVGGIDAGHQNEIYYYVMEFVEGMSLQSILHETGKLPIERAMSITRQIALALDHAHHHGIVHRDVKPDNIILDTQGVAKLADLGLAKFEAVKADASITQTGSIVGSPAYMSPEQALDKELDTRTDLYSLGLTLYEMLTGRRAYSDESPMAMLARKVNEDLSVAGLPEPAASIIKKMCSRKRETRYQTPAELVAAIDGIGGHTPRHNPKTVTRMLRTTGRTSMIPRPSSSPAMAIVVVAVVLGGIFLFLMGGSSARPPAPRPVVREPDPPEPERPPEPAPPPKMAPAPKPAPVAKTDPWEEALQYEKAGHEPDEVLWFYKAARESLRNPDSIAECDKKIEGLQKQVAGLIESARKLLQAAIDDRLRQDLYVSARTELEVARNRFRDSDWQTFVAGLSTRVEERLAAIMAEARRVNDRASWTRVKALQVPECSSEADERLAALERSQAELQQMLDTERPQLDAAWKKAVALARERNYAEAVIAVQSIKLRHPDTTAAALDLVRGLLLAASVIRDASEVKPVDEETPAKWVLSRYQSARRTADPKDQPLAKLLFALFENEPDLAEPVSPLRAEFEALAKEARDLAKSREKKKKDAADFYSRAMRDIAVPSTRDRGLESLRRLLETHADVLSRDQVASIKRTLQAPAPAASGKKEIVVHAEDVANLHGRWKLQDMNHASCLRRVLGTPAQDKGPNDFRQDNPDWFEFTVDVLANEEYAVWIHMSARKGSENSVFIQLEDADKCTLGTDGAAVLQYWRDGETDKFGWTDHDEQHKTDPLRVRFKTAGRKRIRIAVRESGAMVDQIVLSTGKYASARPDQDKLDKTR